MTPDVIIDARGTFCPVPIIKTAEAMRVLDADALIEVISDDPGIEHDMPAWCRSHGHVIESTTVERRVFRFVVRKSPTEAASE